MYMPPPPACILIWGKTIGQMESSCGDLCIMGLFYAQGIMQMNLLSDFGFESNCKILMHILLNELQDFHQCYCLLLSWNPLQTLLVCGNGLAEWSLEAFINIATIDLHAMSPFIMGGNRDIFTDPLLGCFSVYNVSRRERKTKWRGISERKWESDWVEYNLYSLYIEGAHCAYVCSNLYHTWSLISGEETYNASYTHQIHMITSVTHHLFLILVLAVLTACEVSVFQGTTVDRECLCSFLS